MPASQKATRTKNMKALKNPLKAFAIALKRHGKVIVNKRQAGGLVFLECLEPPAGLEAFIYHIDKKKVGFVFRCG